MTPSDLKRAVELARAVDAYADSEPPIRLSIHESVSLARAVLVFADAPVVGWRIDTRTQHGVILTDDPDDCDVAAENGDPCTPLIAKPEGT